MTVQTTFEPARRTIFARIGENVAALYRVVVDASAMAQCAREAERLLALSDEELERRGLTRDRVIPHAFARYMHL